MSAPLMPKATAVWLVDNTSLTFEQIAAYCGLHALEVKGIADGDVAQGIRGKDPISSGELTRDEIRKAQEDPDYRMEMAKPEIEVPEVKTKKGPRYTPTSVRQDRPNAILWLLRSHPELKPSQIMKLVGTTKPTIEAIAERTHWNSANLQPLDPVTMGLCSQIDLDAEVQKAARRVEREQKAAAKAAGLPTGTLLPTEETIAPGTPAGAAPDLGTAGTDILDAPPSDEEAAAQAQLDNAEEALAEEARQAQETPREEEEVPDADSVFAGLAKLKDQLEQNDESSS